MSRRSLNFNSIKVRLKQESTILVICSSEFQFHKGTIKTSILNLLILLQSKFQFHKGTIKTLPLLPLTLCLIRFQFHKGTIKTHSNEAHATRDEISIP